MLNASCFFPSPKPLAYPPVAAGLHRIIRRLSRRVAASSRRDAGKSRTTNSIKTRACLSLALTPDWIFLDALFPRNIRCCAIGIAQQGAGKGRENLWLRKSKGESFLPSSSLRNNVQLFVSLWCKFFFNFPKTTRVVVVEISRLRLRWVNAGFKFVAGWGQFFVKLTKALS